MARQATVERKQRNARTVAAVPDDQATATVRAPRPRRGSANPSGADAFSVTVPSHLAARVPGGDHLLLAAFPLAVSRPGKTGLRIREQLAPGKPYKVIQDQISCPSTGRTVTRTLEVYGSKGAVQPSDEDVLIALIQFTHEYLASSPTATLLISDQEIVRSGGDPLAVMMRLRKIHFKRADLLKRLGITNLSGKNQLLLEQRMQRLSGVDLAVRNAYFHSDGTLATSVGLRLIDSFAFTEGNRYAWFAWSPTMAQLIETGELRALDTDFYFRIQDFLARRLFRHLNIFGKPGRTVYPFSEIVKTRLGLEPSTEYVSKCKDPVERACRELVRLGFLKSYAIDGRFVAEATIALEMPDDYQPSDTFALPFEALIDSFRKDADGADSAEPAARGGLWREASERLARIGGRSAKAKEAALAVTRAIYDAHGPSAAALQHAIDVIQRLNECGIKSHTAVPETLALVERGTISPDGVSADVNRAVDWWLAKRARGERVGPGLLVSALRDPAIAGDETTDSAPADTDPKTPGGVEPPPLSARAAAVWGALCDALRERFGAAAARDWLEPLVPIGLVTNPEPGAAPSRGKRESSLTLWAPNHTFTAYLTGKSALAEALRSEASRAGVGKLSFATEG